MRPSSLILRGLWWRRGRTLAVATAAVLTVTVAALGPLYARAAGESILQDHLDNAGWRAGLHLQADLDISSADAYQRALAASPASGTIRGFDQQIAGLFTPQGVLATPAGGITVATAVAWRDGACGHLVIVSGRCPSAPNEAIASERTVDTAELGFAIGKSVTVNPKPVQGLASPAPPPLHIVGVYRPIDTADAFWFGRPYFAGAITTSVRGEGPNSIDTLFVDRSEFTGLTQGSVVEADFDYPLTTTAVRLSNVDAERTAVTRLLAAHPPTALVAATSGLPTVIDAAASERRLANVGTLLVVLQLAILAWLVLLQVVSNAIDARGNEIAMAKLRGFTPAATIRFGLGEAALILCAALPIGVAAAVGITHLLAGSVLVRGVPVVLPIAAIVTALAAFAGGAIAIGLGGYRTLTRPVLDEWRGTTRSPGRRRLTLVIDVVLAALAVAGFVALRASHHGTSTNDNAALLAPGLLVAAVSLVGVRLLPPFCRWLARLTRASRHVAVFLAVRQVGRRPVGLRLATLLAVAVGLATFAVAGESVAATNRTARARAEVGASQVARVQLDAGIDPVVATERADPDGRWAMAVGSWLPDGGDSVLGTVLGVDSRRLPAIGYAASGGASIPTIARTISADSLPAITVTAPQLRVHVSASGLTGDLPPNVQVNLRTPTMHFYNVESAPLVNGQQVVTVPVSCSAGCTVVGLTWDRSVNANTPESGVITLTGIDVGDGTTWTAVDLQLAQAGSWRAARPAGHAADQVTVSAAGVEDHFANDDGGYGGIVYSYVPSPIPAIATPRAIDGQPAQPQMIDETGASAAFRVDQFTPVLPSVLNDGLIMDVRSLITELPTFIDEAQWSVWLGPDAPPDAAARLGAVGLHVESVRTVSQRVHELGRQGPALALLLLLVCAIAGTVLAVGGTAVSISASSRRRSYEFAALRAVGIRRRALLLASIFEQLLPLGAAAVLGLPVGLLAAGFALPVIPEFGDATPITLRYAPPWLSVALFGVAFIVLLAGTALIAAVALLNSSTPGRLREAEA